MRTQNTHASVLVARASSVYQIVEFGSQKHIDDIISMARLFHAENAPHLNFDPAVIQRYADAVKSDFDREDYNAYVAYRGDEAVGFLVCKMCPYFFNNDRMAIQELWYVRPGFRGSRVAFDLIRAFEDWAQLRGAKEVWTGQANDNPNVGKKISRILTKIGYPKVGSYHKKVTV